MTRVSSPCVKICEMDVASGWCRGCGRTLDEIGLWGTLAEAARRAIMADLPARLEAVGSTVDAPGLTRR